MSFLVFEREKETHHVGAVTSDSSSLSFLFLRPNFKYSTFFYVLDTDRDLP